MLNRIRRTQTIKIWRDITLRKRRTVLVALSVCIGVLGVVAMGTMGTLISRQLEHDLIPREMAMLRVFVEAAPGETIDIDATLELLRAQPDVTRLEGQAVYEFSWKRPGEDEFRTGDLYAYSEPFEEIQIEPVRLVSGRYPVAGQGEIAIERRMAAAHNLNVDDTLIVNVNGGGEQELRIVGLVFQPYMYIGGDDGSNSAYAAYSDAQRIVGFAGFSSFFARYPDFATARQRSGDFRRTILNKTPLHVVFHIRNDPDKNPFLLSIQQFAQVLTMLSVLVLVVACLLVANIIHMIIMQQRQQIGAMKALGATNADILLIYTGMAFLYGAFGTIPGVLLGIVLGQQAAHRVAPLANTVLENATAPAGPVVLGMVLGLALPVLAALPAALNATRITILEAITDTGLEATYGKGPLARLVARLSLPLWLTQPVNNIFRHKTRLALTFAALTASAASLMGMLTAVHTLNGVLTYMEVAVGQHITVSLQETLDLIDLRETVFREEGVQAIAPGVVIELAVLPDAVDETPGTEPPEGAVAEAPEPSPLYIAGIDPVEDAHKIALLEGAGWHDDPQRQGIVLAASVAEKYDKQLGDTLRVQSPSKIAGFPIIGIADFPLGIAFMGWQQLDLFVGVLEDAPTPNAYWEKVRVVLPENVDTLNPDNGDELWALGIDEQVGQFLAAGFDPDQPGVLISRAVAEAGGWQVGDIMRLRPPNGDPVEKLLGDGGQEFPVLAVVDIPLAQLTGLGAEIPPNLLESPEPAVVALHWAALEALVNPDFTTRAPNTFAIDLLNPALEPSFVAPQPVYSKQSSFAGRVAHIMVGISSVMSLASSLMALVGGIGLLTIMSVSVLERQREIGVMRSVGGTSGVILAQFLLEGVIIGVGAWLAALPLSYLISRLLVNLMPFGDVIIFRYSWLVPPAGLLGMLIITALASLYPALDASRKTVADILRYG